MYARKMSLRSKHELRRLGWPVTCLIGFAILFGLSQSIFARDLDRLTRLLIPAFLVQNFALVCSDGDAKFLSDMSNGIASVTEFSDHVKKEVTIDLPEAEASQIRLVAANTARAETKVQLSRFKGSDPVASEKAFREWCAGSVKPFVIDLIRLHGEKHADFDQQVEAAKK